MGAEDRYVTEADRYLSNYLFFLLRLLVMVVLWVFFFSPYMTIFDDFGAEYKKLLWEWAISEFLVSFRSEGNKVKMNILTLIRGSNGSGLLVAK